MPRKATELPWTHHEVEQQFIAAALGERPWQEAMDAAATASGAYGAALFCLNGHPPPAACSENLQDTVAYYIKTGWQNYDERYKGVSLLKDRGVVVDLDFIDMEAIARSAYYQDFLGRFGLRWFAGLRIRSGADLWCLSIQRGASDEPFSPDEQARLVRWCPRLSTAASFAALIERTRLHSSADAFERCDAAAVMLDARGGVLHMNPSAEALLQPGFSVRNKRIRLGDPDAQRSFHRVCAEVASGAVHRIGDPVVAPLPSGGTLLLRILSFGMDHENPFALGRVLVIVDRIGAGPAIATTLLRRIWSLSPAEATVAEKLSRGDDVNQIASALSVSRETVRSQIKSIFRKTGTSRQAELIALFGNVTSLNP